MLKWLQEWFCQLCDGEWEHENSLVIETIDNPGWSIEIDLNNINLNIQSKEWQIYELSEDNWIGYKIDENIYFATGDPLKLEKLIIVFKEIIENEKIDDSFVFSLLES